MVGEIKYQAGSPVEKFISEFLYRIMRSEDRILSKAEVDQLKQQHLLKDCNNKEYE